MTSKDDDGVTLVNISTLVEENRIHSFISEQWKLSQITSGPAEDNGVGLAHGTQVVFLFIYQTRR